MIQKLNEEKINYKKQMELYKDNNLKTFDFLKNLYSRYINHIEEENKNGENINNSGINEDKDNNSYKNDIMLTNHINNFVIKDTNNLKLNTNIDEIINQYNEEQKELKLNYDYGFSNKDARSTIKSEKNNVNNNINNDDIFNQRIKVEKSINTDNLNYINVNFNCTKTLERHKEKIVSLIELNSGRLASGSYDNTIRIWDANYENEDIIIQGKNRVLCLLEFEKNKILCGTSDNVVNLYEINSMNYEFIYRFIGHTLWVNCLTKINNNYFASASNDTTIKIWDYFNKKCIKTLEGHDDCILSIVLLKEKNYLCSGAADLNIRIWNWEKNKCLYILKGHEKWVKCILELDNGIIISGSDDKTIKIWKDYINIKTLEEHKNSIRSLCQINENFFASGSFDFSIKIWDINTWECIQTLVGHESNIICVISLNNNNQKSKTLNYMKQSLLIASCSNDKTIKIWADENN